MEVDDEPKKHTAAEYESLRLLAFFGVCLATTSMLVITVSVPLCYQVRKCNKEMYNLLKIFQKNSKLNRNMK